jgi:hypothetical protein
LLTIYPGNIEPGKYKLFVEFSKSPEGCAFSLWQRATQLSDWIETNDSTREEVKNFYIGEINYSENYNSITMQFKTKPNQSTLLVNRFILGRAQ